MTDTDTDLSKEPMPDPAEHFAFFPSPYSLSRYTAQTTDFDGVTSQPPPGGHRWKVLMIATDERYLMMSNGSMFSTGNHPVEMLLPMLHLDAAGFDIEIATLSGNPVKLEMWAMPRQDEAVQATFRKYLPRLQRPARLADLMPAVTANESPYLAVFVPGGHGVMAGIPGSREVGQVLRAFQQSDRYIISLCHGPACLLAAGIGLPEAEFPFRGYALCVFPDSLDEGANLDIGYMPGRLPWLVGECLSALGMHIQNQGITGQVCRDRKLLTGDSPLASHKLGQMAAAALLDEVARLA